MKTILIGFLLSISSLVLADQAAPLPLEQCEVHAPYGHLVIRKTSTSKICRSGYLLEHDNIAKIPAWVSWSLTPDHAKGCLKRNDAFATDLSLEPEARASTKDYAKSGYDTGHMANDGDFRWSAEVSRQSFILSNMTPQLPGFNRGIWKKLEDQTRGWAISRQHELIVYAGSIYNRKSSDTIGAGRVVIPTAFYKVIIDTETSEVLAFLFKHESSTEDLQEFIMSLAEIQRQAGVIFALPEGYTASAKLWPITEKSALAAKRVSCTIN